MARKRQKQKTRIVYRNKKRKQNKDKSMFNLNGVMTPIAAIGYGLVRERISDTIAQSKIGQSLPITQFTDEAVMLAALWGVNKVVKPKGLFGSLFRTGKIVEYARIGSTIDQLYIRKNASNGVSNIPRLG